MKNEYFNLIRNHIWSPLNIINLVNPNVSCIYLPFLFEMNPLKSQLPNIISTTLRIMYTIEIIMLDSSLSDEYYKRIKSLVGLVKVIGYVAK